MIRETHNLNSAQKLIYTVHDELTKRFDEFPSEFHEMLRSNLPELQNIGMRIGEMERLFSNHLKS